MEYLSKVRREKDLSTISGIPVKEVYRPKDIEDLIYQRDLSEPGEFPYTRGVYPTMYRGQFWTMREVMGLGTGKNSNERIRYLLEMGETGIAVVPDQATCWGIDGDDPRAEGEVARLGVALSSLRDMEDLFEGIALDKITISLVVEGIAPYVLAMYLALAKKRGIPLAKLIGSIQNDVLRGYYARGAWIVLPVRASLKMCIDLIEFCTKNVPKWNVNTIAGYQTRDSGGTAIQEVAFLLADTMAYVEACLDRGMKIDEFAPRFSFYMSSHTCFFEEIAKFRAVRRMYAEIMKEKYGANNPKSCSLRVHVQTAANTLTAQQPLNNMARVTLQALAAVLGGVQSLHTNAMDEAYATPTKESAMAALRVQQIIAHESGGADTVDPLAGSYFVESLTLKLEQEAWDLISKIQEKGHTMLEAVLNCIDSGFFEKEILSSYYLHQQDIQSGKRIIVGVNAFKIDEEVDIPTLTYDAEWPEQQKANLRRLRRERDNIKVEACLNKLKREAEAGVNLFPTLIEAAEAYATIGEVYETLKSFFGAHCEIC